MKEKQFVIMFQNVSCESSHYKDKQIELNKASMQC